MSINFAILGMLSVKPLTGYELKKVMQTCEFMPWSGNNNQIYKALLELEEGGCVTGEVYHQEGAPSKKVYTITAAGVDRLKHWTLLEPEGVEIRKPFLLGLAWADLLRADELEAQLNHYRQAVKGQLLIEQGRGADTFWAQGRTPRETALWGLIQENILSSYQNELDWIDRARTVLTAFGGTEPGSGDCGEEMRWRKDMSYQIMEKAGKRYVVLGTDGKQIESQQDARWMSDICIENDVSFLLIHGQRLSDDFFRLQTGLAGVALQRFAMYQIKVAVILEQGRLTGRVREMMAESNRGGSFRSFASLAEAENWLFETEGKAPESS